jgi:MFS family permease
MFGFFGAVFFLPLWFQVVKGTSVTASGYNLLPFLAGLIGSSVVSGFVVSRTGRYKWLLVGALVVAGAGVALMTNIRADTPYPTLWLWMVLAGIGIGPTMAVFTIIVQNAVRFDELGAATADLTLFRQMGGVVGLTLAYTLFRNFLTWDAIRTQVVAAGVPASALPTTAPAGFDPGALTNVGGGAPSFLAQVPAAMQDAFVTGIHRAFSIALGNSLWLGVGAMALAVLSTLVLHELPLRHHFGDVAEEDEVAAPHGELVPGMD